jgi:hypothetical protein
VIDSEPAPEKTSGRRIPLLWEVVLVLRAVLASRAFRLFLGSRLVT